MSNLLKNAETQSASTSGPSKWWRLLGQRLPTWGKEKDVVSSSRIKHKLSGLLRACANELRLRFFPFQFPIFCEVSVTTCHDIMHQHDIQFIMRFGSLFPMILVGSSFVASCSRGADGNTLITSRVVMLHPHLYVVKLRVEPASLETTIHEIVYH